MKKKTFTVYYKTGGLFEARISAENLKEAAEKACAMSKAELDKTPGDVIEEDVPVITAVFE